MKLKKHAPRKLHESNYEPLVLLSGALPMELLRWTPSVEYLINIKKENKSYGLGEKSSNISASLHAQFFLFVQ